jgi:hypothetical protein
MMPLVRPPLEPPPTSTASYPHPGGYPLERGSTFNLELLGRVGPGRLIWIVVSVILRVTLTILLKLGLLAL